jgi:iron(III) transport system permease protein
MIVLFEKKSRGLASISPTSSNFNSVFKLNKSKYLGTVFLAVIYGLSLGFPAYVLLSRSLSVRTEINLPKLVELTLNTTWVAFLGAMFSILLALPIAILVSRFKSRFAKTLETTFLITHALPGVVIGLSLVAIGAKYLTGIYQTLYLLAIAYALLFVANSLGSIRSNLEKIPINFEEISRSLGQNYFQTLRRVVLPIATPGIVSGWLLVFVSAMKELPATLMLKPTGFETLSTSLWTATSISQFAQAAPFALALVLVASIPSYILNKPNVAQKSIISENLKYD